MSTKKFSVKINLVILGTEIHLNKQYLLSLNQDEMILPSLYLDKDFLSDIETKVTEHAQTLIFTNELELLPQIISLNTKFIESKSNEINVIYGFVITKTDNINNCYWIEFDYMNPNKYSQLLFEVTQKLK